MDTRKALWGGLIAKTDLEWGINMRLSIICALAGIAISVNCRADTVEKGDTCDQCVYCPFPLFGVSSFGEYFVENSTALLATDSPAVKSYCALSAEDCEAVKQLHLDWNDHEFLTILEPVVKKALDAAPRKRLVRLWLALEGAYALRRGEVADQLELSPRTRSDIDGIVRRIKSTDVAPNFSAFFVSKNNSQILGSLVNMTLINCKCNSAILATLTEAEKEQLKSFLSMDISNCTRPFRKLHDEIAVAIFASCQ